MAFRAYCRIPKNSSKKYVDGSVPELLDDLIKELSGAEEIFIAFYLFNNERLADFLIREAERGCKVTIISLPLNGYSDKQTMIHDIDKKLSPREMAEKVYERLSNAKNITLFVFPHMYTWYGALYVGGNASYSFHIKALFARFGNSTKCFISSGNFLTGDPPHSDSITVAENEPKMAETYNKFFEDIIKKSVEIETYKSKFKNPLSDFVYVGGYPLIEVSNNNLPTFFTTPFYKINGQGSNHYASKRLIDLINDANERILICAQHFHDIISFDPNAKTIIGALKRKMESDPKIKVRVLKQLSHSGLADKRRAAITETLFQFVLKVPQRFNKLVHDKFIIVDDKIAITTANYTPTQFAWGERDMESKYDGSTYYKVDIFSEVNAFMILGNAPEVVAAYEKHFEKLWQGGQDIVINI